jgi:hypothetical protein
MTHDASAAQAAAWIGALCALIEARRLAPFAWGSNDCCMFAADAAQAQTGTDPAAAERGTYNDARGAAQVLARLGGIEAIGARAGDPIPPLCAVMGDVGLIRQDKRQLLAVCAGDAWIAPGALGLASSPLDAASLAWRVRRA